MGQDNEEAALRAAQRQLGARVRALREARGWSQDTFAHLAGLHRAYPHRIEAAKVDVRYSTLVRLARVLEVTVADLVGDGD